VALGIGSAVTGMQVAWADPAGSGTGHGGAGSNRTGSAPHAHGAAKNSGTHKRRATAATGTRTVTQTDGAAKDSTTTSAADSTANSPAGASRHRTPRRAAKAGTDASTDSSTSTATAATGPAKAAAAVAATTDTTVKTEVAQNTVTVVADQTTEVSTATKEATEYVEVKTEAETADADEYVIVVPDEKTEVVTKDTTVYVKGNETEYAGTDPVKTETETGTYVETDDGTAIKDTTNSGTIYENGGSESGQTATTDDTKTIYNPIDPDTGSSSGTQTATVTVSSVAPSGGAVRPLHNLVLGVLGLFGFHPGTGTWSNPILAGIWGTYRRIEAFFDNAEPRIVSAQVVSTGMTTDGRTAVTLAVSATDLDGDTLRYSTKSGAHGTLTANTDGTFTYVADAGYTGTDTVTITANDAGHFHFHGLLSIFEPNWGHTSTAKLTLTLTEDSTPAATVTTIDSVVSTPGTGNSWTVTVAAHSSDESRVLDYKLTATDAEHVTVSTTATSGVYVVTVSDNDWAASNPGGQITVTATAADGTNEASSTLAIGTVNNAATLNIGALDPAAIPALPAGVSYLKAAGTGLTFELIRSDGGIDSVLTLDSGNMASSISWPATDALAAYAAIKRTSSGTIVLLRSDGQAVAIGADGTVQTQTIPALGDGLTYTDIVPAVSTAKLSTPGVLGVLLPYEWSFIWTDDGTIDIDRSTLPLLGVLTAWNLEVRRGAPLQLQLSDGTFITI